MGFSQAMMRRDPRPAGGQPHDVEQQLRRSLADGDYRGAAHEVVRLYADEVYRFCVHAIGNRPDGEDLAQDVLGEACRCISRFRGRSTVRTWLYRIAWHKVYDQRKRYSRQPNLVPIDGLITSEVVRLSAGRDQPDEALAASQRHKQVARALRRLSSDDRLILFLRIGQDLPYSEIAGVLGVREGAAKMRVNRAVSRLKVEVNR